MESLPLGIMSRIVTVNDSLLALVPLLEKKPWQRRRVSRLQTHLILLWAQDLITSSHMSHCQTPNETPLSVHIPGATILGLVEASPSAQTHQQMAVAVNRPQDLLLLRSVLLMQG